MIYKTHAIQTTEFLAPQRRLVLPTKTKTKIAINGNVYYDNHSLSNSMMCVWLIKQCAQMFCNSRFNLSRWGCGIIPSRHRCGCVSRFSARHVVNRCSRIFRPSQLSNYVYHIQQQKKGWALWRSPNDWILIFCYSSPPVQCSKYNVFLIKKQLTKIYMHIIDIQ